MASGPPGYELVRLLGEGGMGCVHEAVHLASGRHVALKTLGAAQRSDAAWRRLLIHEATAVARLRHPNVVELLDLEQEADGSPALVMELVAGHDLDGWQRSWPGWDGAWHALDDVLAALAVAHGEGIVHRDLKPANLLRDASGHVKITDFGIAAVLDPLKASDSTWLAGTPMYMAPEQLALVGVVGPWTDLYAFGCIAYEILAGMPAFPQPTLGALREAKGRGPPRLQPRSGLSLPQELFRLIAACMRPDPRARPRFAADVRRRLAALARFVVDDVERVGPARPGARHTAAGAALAATMESSELSRTVPPVVPATELVRTESVRMESVPEESEPGEPARDTVLSRPVSLGASVGFRSVALHRLRALPLVGRAKERAILGAAIEEVCSRGGTRVVLLTGEAGVGKSRLARWGLSRVEHAGLMEGAATGYDMAVTELAGGLRHLFTRLLGAPGPGEAGTIPAAWRWLAPGDASDPLAGSVLPFDVAAMQRWLRGGDEARLPAHRVVELAHDTLRALSKVRPVYVWLDDVGWSRDGALELVSSLLDAQDAAVLVVATVRSGTAEHPMLRDRLASLAGREDARVLHIDRLGLEDRRELLGAIVPLASDVSAALADRIDETPLLLVELVHDWLEAKLLVESDEGARPPAGQSVDAILAARPVKALLENRIDAFLAMFGEASADAEAILQRAALLGERFEDAALLACSPDPDRAAAVLDRALLCGILRAQSGRRAYRFEHGLVHELLLARLDRHPGRAAILTTTARGIVRAYGSRRAEITARAARLLHEAGESHDAFDALQTATEAFSRGGAIDRATEMVQLGREWLAELQVPAMDVRRSRMLHADAHRLFFDSRYDEALAAAQEACRGFEQLGERSWRARARALQADIHSFTDRFAEARELAREVASETPADSLGAETSALAQGKLAELETLDGRLEDAHRSLQSIVESTRGWAASFVHTIAARNLVWIETVAGRLDDAARRAEALVDAARADGDEIMLADSLDARRAVDYRLGCYSEAVQGLDARLRSLESARDAWRLTSLRLLAALVAVERDPIEAAARAADLFCQAFCAVHHDEPFTRWGMGVLAARLRERGAPDQAADIERLRDARATAIARGFGKDPD